jgi:hypothetical protein
MPRLFELFGVTGYQALTDCTLGLQMPALRRLNHAEARECLSTPSLLLVPSRLNQTQFDR